METDAPDRPGILVLEAWCKTDWVLDSSYLGITLFADKTVPVQCLYPTRSCRSAHQGKVGHFVVDILVSLGLGPGGAPVHVGGQFAPLRRGHAHRRGRARGSGQAGARDSSEGLRCSRAVAGHIDSRLVHHSVIPHCSVITALSDKI